MEHGHPYGEIAGLLRRRSLDRKPWLKRLPPPARPAGPQPSSSALRLTFPVTVSGSSGTNSTCRGYS